MSVTTDGRVMELPALTTTSAKMRTLVPRMPLVLIFPVMLLAPVTKVTSATVSSVVSRLVARTSTNVKPVLPSAPKVPSAQIPTAHTLVPVQRVKRETERLAQIMTSVPVVTITVT